MRTFLGIALLLSFAAGTVRADGMDPLVASDSRMRTLTYDESDVYTITTKYGYQTNIVFGPQEEIMTISVGDRSLWQLIPSGNRLFIRPMMENVTTNMTVLTNKHSYQFDLKSVGADKGGNIYVARFTYPGAKPVPAVFIPPAHSAIAAGSGVAPAQVMPSEPLPSATPRLYLNYNYTYAGPDDLAPIEVYDDGHSTFIKYSDANQPLPDIYIVDYSGNEKRVGYYLNDNIITVNQVVGEMALKRSDGTLYLYNESLNPK